MTRAVLALSVMAALQMPAYAQANAAFHYPDDGLFEVRRHKPVPDLLAALIPPLAFLNILGNDSLAKLPTRAVQFRVVDEAGKVVPKALVALIYRKSNRFLAEGSAGGPALRIPHGNTTDVPKRPGSYDLVYLLGAVGAMVEAGRVPIEVLAP